MHKSLYAISPKNTSSQPLPLRIQTTPHRPGVPPPHSHFLLVCLSSHQPSSAPGCPQAPSFPPYLTGSPSCPSRLICSDGRRGRHPFLRVRSPQHRHFHFTHSLGVIWASLLWLFDVVCLCLTTAVRLLSPSPPTLTLKHLSWTNGWNHQPNGRYF